MTNLVGDLLWLQLLLEVRGFGRAPAADQLDNFSQCEAELLSRQNHLEAHPVGSAIEARIALPARRN